MGEAGRDLFYVVGHQHQWGPCLSSAHFVEVGDELFSSAYVEAGGWFVEEDQGGIGHQGSREEDALAFAG